MNLCLCSHGQPRHELAAGLRTGPCAIGACGCTEYRPGPQQGQEEGPYLTAEEWLAAVLAAGEDETTREAG